MSLNDTVALVANYTAVPFATIGFGITFWQLGRTKRAATAAGDAARAAQREISRNSLMVLIPQLQRAEDELERAVHDNTPELVISWLSTWRWQAGQVRGFLRTSGSNDVASDKDIENISKALQKSIVMASRAKSSLLGNDKPNLPNSTKNVRDAIASATGELGLLVSVSSTTHGDAK